LTEVALINITALRALNTAALIHTIIACGIKAWCCRVTGAALGLGTLTFAACVLARTTSYRIVFTNGAEAFRRWRRAVATTRPAVTAMVVVMRAIIAVVAAMMPRITWGPIIASIIRVVTGIVAVIAKIARRVMVMIQIAHIAKGAIKPHIRPVVVMSVADTY
jgi:hypothetical protein